MMQHDPRCEGPDDEKVLADVREYGWHVLEIFEMDETPGWAFSIGLYKNFNHPEIVVFGLNDGLMHSVINSIGAIRIGYGRNHCCFMTSQLPPELRRC